MEIERFMPRRRDLAEWVREQGLDPSRVTGVWGSHGRTPGSVVTIEYVHPNGQGTYTVEHVAR